ncbi:MAG: C-GCAxxG-C-C family protein [Candidatus Thorarchaeota archaeon]
MDELNISDIEKKAIELFKSGYICAEAVSKAVLSYMDYDSETICGVATGFGGGISRQGQVCGALSGGIISIGAVVNKGFRKPEQIEIKNQVYEKVQTLYKKFESNFGSVICKNLTNCDLTKESGRKKFSENNVEEKVCNKLVGWTTLETIKLLHE